MTQWLPRVPIRKLCGFVFCNKWFLTIPDDDSVLGGNPGERLNHNWRPQRSQQATGPVL